MPNYSRDITLDKGYILELILDFPKATVSGSKSYMMELLQEKKNCCILLKIAREHLLDHDLSRIRIFRYYSLVPYYLTLLSSYLEIFTMKSFIQV